MFICILGNVKWCCLHFQVIQVETFWPMCLTRMWYLLATWRGERRYLILSMQLLVIGFLHSILYYNSIPRQILFLVGVGWRHPPMSRSFAITWTICAPELSKP